MRKSLSEKHPRRWVAEIPSRDCRFWRQNAVGNLNRELAFPCIAGWPFSPARRVEEPHVRVFRLDADLCNKSGERFELRKEENYDSVEFGQKRLRGDRALRF
jgi:hypothetical protein